ncbi:MAG: alpha/beta hydrolase [Candidatus Pacebacteria bacterium]|nr:alpha/beta hydrolase [Candidatus Paceibacterota bacterium]
MEEKKISVNSLTINYKITEEEDPLLSFAGIKFYPEKVPIKGTILILHGWGGSSDSWIEVQKNLIKNGYKTIVPDLPGFGKSVTPLKAWGIDDYTDFVSKFAEKINLTGPFFLLGHSFGGRIAIRFVLKHPEKIKGLILCDSAGIKPKMGIKTMLIYWTAKLGNALLTPKHFSRFRDSARNFFYAVIRHRDYEKADGVMKETIIKVLNEDLFADLSKIKTKTLLVWGKNDKMVPVKYANVFKINIENSELEILPKIGHSPHLEVPDKLSEILLKFLNKF